MSFTGHLNGVQGAPGVYGYHTLTQTFYIGASLIAIGNTAMHRTQIYYNGRLRYNWPISSGRPGDDTPNGSYLTIEKANPVQMTGPGYSISVPWSVRFTFSGDYYHDAYWSVGEQGFHNVSHGCVNLSPADAQTYYELAVPGDPITIAGSPKSGTWDNGWTEWFLSWPRYLRGSALHQAVQAGPDGSTFSTRRRCLPRPPLPPSRPPPPITPAGSAFPLQVAGRHPAVDKQRGPGDEFGLVAGVEHRRGGDVAGLADPADGRHRPAVAALGPVLSSAVLLAGRGHVPHAGPDVTRAEHVGAHAVRAAVQREHLAQHDHGGLGHRVKPGRLLAPDPRVRGDVDHAAAPPGQVRVGGLRVQQVAAHVDVHHPVVVGERGIDQPGGDAHAGVVHQHVQAAEVTDGGAHRRRDRRPGPRRPRP